MQVKNSFDNITLQKIFKSFLFASLSGISAGLTCYTQTRDVNLSIITGLAALTSFIVNIPLEYRKGIDEVD